MARGNSSRGGRVAESELSERLRREALALRIKNEAERQEAETNQNDYDDALKSAYMRAEEETNEDFRGKRMSVNEREQAEREAKAKEAEEAAKAEEEREAQEKLKESEVFSKFEKDVKRSALTYDDWTNAKWYMTLDYEGDAELKKLIPDIYQDDRNHLSKEYIQESIAYAPPEIREAVTTALMAFAPRGKNDSFPGESAEVLYKGLNQSYAEGAFGRGSKAFVDVEQPDKSRIEGLDEKKHNAGMKALKKTDAYLAKVLIGARNHLVDKDGNKVG